jgi:hypothetical protein
VKLGGIRAVNRLGRRGTDLVKRRLQSLPTTHEDQVVAVRVKLVHVLRHLGQQRGRHGIRIPGRGKLNCAPAQLLEHGERVEAAGGGIDELVGHQRDAERSGVLLHLLRQEGHEPLVLDLGDVAGKLMLDADHPRCRQAALGQLAQQLLGEDPAALGQLGCPVRPLRPPAPVGVRARDVDAQRGTSLQTDDDDVVSALDMGLYRAGDGVRDAGAMPPVGERVVLLAYRPESVQPGEGELGTGHLLQLPALFPEHLHQRRVDAGTASAAGHLGVLIEQAVGDERDASQGGKDNG